MSTRGAPVSWQGPATPLRPRSATLLLLAVVAGLCAANLYYVQPLLTAMARAFAVEPSALAPTVWATQAGYAVGLLLVVPLGDVVDRRRLVTVLLAIVAALLVVLPFTSGVALFVMFGLVGLSTVSGMVIVPWAADLAEPEQRGRVTGTIMSGLFVGVLLCRGLAGLLESLGGWRSVYWFSAACMLGCVVVVRRLPIVSSSTAPPRYGRLLLSVGEVARSDVRILERSVYGALCFGAFNAFWTALPIHLAGPPFGYGAGVVGLLGLLAASAVVGAAIAGQMADRGRQALVTLLAFLVVLATFVMLGLAPTSLAAVIGGVLLLDFAVQSAHITNQSVIYAVTSTSRSRVTTVYMTTYFAGGAAGSALAGAAWRYGGWQAACWVGAGFVMFALFVYAVFSLFRR